MSHSQPPAVLTPDTLRRVLPRVGAPVRAASRDALLLLALALLWLLATWLGRVIEQRISQAAFVNPGMQVALVKLSKFTLMVLAFLLALNAVGIDLTALAVFGGALGVGLGFGLQRIASNFISGFIVLFDRSIRPGDVISVDQSFGWVQALHARYRVALRARD